jgi:hypothetical protein
MHRLKVVPHRNWKGQPGYAWTCEATAAHPNGKPISGFSREETFTGRWQKHYPSARSRAMDGARKHLMRYHHLEDR